MRNVFVTLMLIAALLLSMAPAMAEMPSITRWAGGVLNNSTTKTDVTVSEKAMRDTPVPWQPFKFRMPNKERMMVKVIPIGDGSFGGKSTQEYNDLILESISRFALRYGPERNIRLFTGALKQNDLLLEVKFRVVSGKDYNSISSSNSDYDSWKHSTRSSSNSDSDSRETMGMYILLSPTLYRIGEGEDREILAAPAARISASDAEMTGSESSDSSSRSSSYYHRGRGSSSSHSASDQSSWQNDEEMSKATMADGLVMKLSQKAITLVFEDLGKSLQTERYNEILDKEAEAKESTSGEITFTVEQPEPSK